MTRGQDYYRETILDDAWVTVFTATNTAMFTYPYVLGNPEECSPTLADISRTYIMDSKIGDDAVGNERVIERGKDIGADIVVPADVIGDVEMTIERTIDMLSLVEKEESYDPQVVIPLQQDDEHTHVEHYERVAAKLWEHGYDVSDYIISVGGVKDAASHEQLRILCELRERVGEDQYIHGLGFGATANWIATLRRAPTLVDSIDMSSVVQDVVNAKKLLTPDMERVDYKLPRGQNSTVLSVMLREFVLYMMMYYLGPHPNEKDVPTEITNEKMKSVLNEYGY